MISVPNIQLKGSVGPDRANDQWDVFRLQLSLRAIRDSSTGQPFFSGDLNGRFDDVPGQAMGVFASRHAIPFNGVADNNSRFLHLITDDLRGVHLPPPPRTHLTFDGSRMCWIEAMQTRKCWSGVSGRQGYQKKEHQSLESYGPVPEGRWLVRQSRHQ